MNTPRFGRLLLVLASAFLLTVSNWAGAEPSSRAARLGYISGTVSFSPAGDDDWRRARVNRPLTTGDRLWVDDGARAELQVGGAAIRLGGGTSLTLVNLDDRIVQLELTEGSLRVRVHRLGRNQAFEVNTPNLAFTMSRVGEYRIDVDANDDATAVHVRSGRGEAYGERRSYVVNAKQGFRFYGTGLSDYDRMASRDDDLDRWARERDRSYATSVSARYVSGDVVGYEELDSHGTWRKDPTYGNVWAPNRVASGWTPYRDGHWEWIDPWGWTWVDDQPWGYAVSHYGRWANVRGSWVWVPGPRNEPAVYAPAQVAFVGGGASPVAAAAVGVLAALVGWFPLAPREVYHPPYQVSRGYFERMNRSNAVVAPTVINNYYNTTIVTNNTTGNRGPRARQVYANQRVQGAVVAVPPQAFTRAQPVAQAVVPVPQQTAAAAQPAPAPTAKPDRQSRQGGVQAAEIPRNRDRDRRVVARTAPPAPAKPAAGAAAPAAAPQPAVVTAVQAPAPTAPPPAVAPAPRSQDERRADAGKRDARGEGRKGDRDNAKADAKGDSAKAEAAKGGAAKADAAKADAAKADAAKADAAKADAAKAEAAKSDAAKADAAKADAAKSAAAKADAAKADAAKAAAAAEAAKAEAARADAVKADAAKGAERKRDRDKADAAKNEDRKNEERRRDRDKADAGKADAARAEAAKAESARAEAAKAAAAKAEASRADAAKAEAAKAEAAKAEAARRDAAAKAEVAKAAAAKAAAEKAAAEKAAADKAAAEKAAADKAAAEKAAAPEAAKAAAGKADAARAEAKAAREKARALRTDAEKAEDDRKKGAN